MYGVLESDAIWCNWLALVGGAVPIIRKIAQNCTPFGLAIEFGVFSSTQRSVWVRTPDTLTVATGRLTGTGTGVFVVSRTGTPAAVFDASLTAAPFAWITCTSARISASSTSCAVTFADTAEWNAASAGPTAANAVFQTVTAALIGAMSAATSPKSARWAFT